VPREAEGQTEVDQAATEVQKPPVPRRGSRVANRSLFLLCRRNSTVVASRLPRLELFQSFVEVRVD
jgi:hypothetical protein